MVQLLHLDGTIWRFLGEVKQNGLKLSRAGLVDRVGKDLSLLKFMGDMVGQAAASCDGKAAARMDPAAWQARFSWYAATLVGALDRMHNPSEELLRVLVPQLLRGFGAKAAPELQVACYMVAAKLATRTMLAPKTCEALLVAAAKSPCAQYPEHSLACVMMIAQSQDLAELPPSAFQFLVKMQNLDELLLLVAPKVDVARVAALLIDQFVDHVPRHSNFANDLCRLVSSDLPIRPHVSSAVERVLRVFVLNADGEASELRERIANVVQQFSACYPQETDEGVQTAIASFEPSEQRPKKKKKKKHSTGGADLDAGSADAAQQQRQQKAILFSLLSASFSAQQMRHLPLEDMGMTFFLALEHETAQVRRRGRQSRGEPPSRRDYLAPTTPTPPPSPSLHHPPTQPPSHPTTTTPTHPIRQATYTRAHFPCPLFSRDRSAPGP